MYHCTHRIPLDRMDSSNLQKKRRVLLTFNFEKLKRLMNLQQDVRINNTQIVTIPV